MNRSDSRRNKAARIRNLLTTERENIEENTLEFNEGRYASVAGLEDYDDLKDRARSIKEDSVARLPELIDQVTETVEDNGGHVYYATDAEDANEYVKSLVETSDAETVVKSKSMTTEELDLNAHLEDGVTTVRETDLGEFVLQVAEEEPSHLVGPSIHKSQQEIADLFNSHFELDEPLETAEELTRFARNYLGERIDNADIGITGANFVLADSGTIVLVTNEGNARKCVVAPDTHVAVTGVEKLIPSMETLPPFIELIARSATGQDITQYISMFSPPVVSPTIDFDSPDTPITDTENDRDFHLVLVDNGRMTMREDDDLRETLYCIRCGACANSCANFQSVGGHAFGGETYTGGIATGWETGVSGLDSAAEFNDLCTGCTRCVNACPVQIDIPWINTVVRDRINQGTDRSTFDSLVSGLTPDVETTGLDPQKRFFGNFERIAKVASTTAPVSNWIANTKLSKLVLERLFGVDRRRDLPPFQRLTLQNWFESHDGLAPTDAEREAVLFPDLYTNYIHVDRGKAAVLALEAMNVSVSLGPVLSSGREPLSQGMIETARRCARRVHDGLASARSADVDVVVIEPSDLAMFHRDYEKLLSAQEYEWFRNSTYELMEYLYGLLENDAPTDELRGGNGEPVRYHSHCQQRTLGLEVYTDAVLETLNYDVATSNVECCGMAGSFGYKEEYYELSMDVGNRLQEQFENGGREGPVVANGASCTEQLDTLLGSRTTHPVEIIAPLE